MKNIISQALAEQCNQAIVYAKNSQTSFSKAISLDRLCVCKRVADHCHLIDLNINIEKAIEMLEKGEFISVDMPIEHEGSERPFNGIDFEDPEMNFIMDMKQDLEELIDQNEKNNLQITSTDPKKTAVIMTERLPAVKRVIDDTCQTGLGIINLRMSHLMNKGSEGIEIKEVDTASVTQ